MMDISRVPAFLPLSSQQPVRFAGQLNAKDRLHDRFSKSAPQSEQVIDGMKYVLSHPEEYRWGAVGPFENPVKNIQIKEASSDLTRGGVQALAKDADVVIQEVFYQRTPSILLPAREILKLKIKDGRTLDIARIAGTFWNAANLPTWGEERKNLKAAMVIGRDLFRQLKAPKPKSAFAPPPAAIPARAAAPLPLPTLVPPPTEAASAPETPEPPSEPVS